jgi:predicted CopG family antitoxin
MYTNMQHMDMLNDEPYEHLTNMKCGTSSGSTIISVVRYTNPQRNV